MLVLSRRIGEEIVISDHVRLRVVEVNGNRVKLGISAPDSVPVHREEVYRQQSEFGARLEAAVERLRGSA